ncbi:basic amino acid/polyamine antiporter [Acidocella facilis]|uniref:basic amino acid/polyamine antiporter n=1 Tax=Acidocella facilis TaxID=525 RepID=UPI001F2079C0|nr:basic amino acid/polyamine antiporter [Acidocella facilis]
MLIVSKPKSRQLGVLLLSALVISSMIGGGAFDLPQNMAATASLGAIIIAWGVTLFGMSFLANTFRTLADQRPDLTAGIYSYGREGFGKFAGFMMAWGYWISSALGNVAFAVLTMQVLGYFFPIFGQGQNVPSLIGGSVLIWVMCVAVVSGVKRVAVLNLIATILKVTGLIAAIIIMSVAINIRHFEFDFLGRAAYIGGVMQQVKSTMLITLWVFLGIEGAVVVSDRARSQNDVGKATFIGLAVCTILYALISILPFGIMTQSQLAHLRNPSAAYVLNAVAGRWGGMLVNLALLVSVVSSWLAWTILTAELPFMAAKDGVFPKFLAKENARHAPAPSLWISSVVMQIAMFSVLFAHNAWIWLITVTGAMSLPPYLASTAYLWKFANDRSYHPTRSETRTASIITGVLGTVYSVWLLYAAGTQFLLLSALMYIIGVPVFWWAQREQRLKLMPNQYELLAMFLLLIASIAAIVLFKNGAVKLG